MGARGKSAAQPILPLLPVAVQPLPLLSLCPPGLIPVLGRSLAGPLEPTGAWGRQNSCGGSTATCHWTSSHADRHSDQLTDLEFCPLSSTSSRGTRLNLKHATTLSPANEPPACPPARPIVSCAHGSPRHLLPRLSPSIFSSTTCRQSVAKQTARSIGWINLQDGPRLSTIRHDGIRCQAMPCHAMRLIFTAPLPPAATVDHAGHLTRVTGKGTLLAAVPSKPLPQPLRAT